MANSPLFSVIIPTYNRADKVIRAVESVLKQTCQDFEIILIDDGSIDHTALALRPYQERISYTRTVNQGVSAARNLGISRTIGKYICFLDADDRWLPEMLAEMASAIQAHPNVGIFCTGAHYVNESGRVLWTVKPKPVVRSAYDRLLRSNFIVLSGAVVRKDCLDHELFDPTMTPCEDWDLWLRIARYAAVCVVPGSPVLYEYAAPDKLTSNYQKWIVGHDHVLEKTFAADPSLSSSEKNQILSSIAYIKGRICLEAGEDQEARKWFLDSLHSTQQRWKAWIYLILLSLPAARGLLPARIKTALRLPEIQINTPGGR